MRAPATILLAAGLLAGCAGGHGAPACVTNAVAPDDVAVASGYRLGPQDQVKVTVYRQEELSGQFALDGEGELALPLLGEIQAAGLSSRQLENAIEQRLASGGFLVDPQVGVQLLTYRPFYILGEVAKPGSYEYRDGMTVINAVALAGGYSYRADTDDVRIERGNCAMPTMADTSVLPGDIVKVSERFF